MEGYGYLLNIIVSYNVQDYEMNKLKKAMTFPK